MKAKSLFEMIVRANGRSLRSYVFEGARENLLSYRSSMDLGLLRLAISELAEDVAESNDVSLDGSMRLLEELPNERFKGETSRLLSSEASWRPKRRRRDSWREPLKLGKRGANANRRGACCGRDHWWR